MAETNTQTVVRVLLSPAAALESALQQLLTERNVNTARGFVLDLIGKLVGRPRAGIADDEIYRRYVRAQIATNKSDGLIEDVLTIANLVVYDDDATYVLRNEGAACFVLAVEGIALPDEVAAVLIDLLILAASAGVRPILEYSTQDPSTVLRWSTQGVWGTAVWARAVDGRI